VDLPETYICFGTKIDPSTVINNITQEHINFSIKIAASSSRSPNNLSMYFGFYYFIVKLKKKKKRMENNPNPQNKPFLNYHRLGFEITIKINRIFTQTFCFLFHIRKLVFITLPIQPHVFQFSLYFSIFQ
jgi:hypothetical protein